MYLLSLLSTYAGIASAATIGRRTSYEGPTNKGSFQLEVVATAGNLAAYTGQFLNPYHTAAGGNVLTLVNNQTAAYSYNFSTATGELSSVLGGGEVYYLTLSSILEGFHAPTGYNYTGFDIGGTTDHFQFSTPGNYLQFPAADSGYKFSVCPAEIYTPGVYVDTLLYRKSDAKTNGSCADVKVKAIF